MIALVDELLLASLSPLTITCGLLLLVSVLLSFLGAPWATLAFEADPWKNLAGEVCITMLLMLEVGWWL